RPHRLRQSDPMTPMLVQLGITDRTALAAARRSAGGEAVLAGAFIREAGKLVPIAPVLLSTCERMEVYAFATPDESGRVAAQLGRSFDGHAARPAFERRIGEAAVAHLFAVAT